MSLIVEPDTHDLLQRFTQWMESARDAGEHEPNAMCLATCGERGTPSARIVLLKGITAGASGPGLVFFTNHGSRKAQHIRANQSAALCFHWKTTERQVRFEGVLEKVSDGESDEYFDSRPRGSQVGAWASRQSQILEDRAVLERAVEETSTRFADGSVPRPEFWGGYRLLPQRVEFWLGRQSRLHDREHYRWDGSRWLAERLYP